MVTVPRSPARPPEGSAARATGAAAARPAPRSEVARGAAAPPAAEAVEERTAAAPAAVAAPAAEEARAVAVPAAALAGQARTAARMQPFPTRATRGTSRRTQHPTPSSTRR